MNHPDEDGIQEGRYSAFLNCMGRCRSDPDPWGRTIPQHYGVPHPEQPDLWWCPVMQQYGARSQRTAFRIVPQTISFPTVEYIFGASDWTKDPYLGLRILWDLENGLIVDNAVAEALKNSDAVLCPVPSDPDEPRRWMFIIINDSLLGLQVFPNITETLTFGELHGRELAFRNYNRPGTQQLYFHYVTSLIMRLQRGQTLSWLKSVHEGVDSIGLWTLPGPFMRRSMLGYIARWITGLFSEGFNAPWGDLFRDGTFEAENSKRFHAEIELALDVYFELGPLKHGDPNEEMYNDGSTRSSSGSCSQAVIEDERDQA